MDVKTTATFLGNRHQGEGDQIVGQCVGSRAVFFNAQITCCNGFSKSAAIGAQGCERCVAFASCAAGDTGVTTLPPDEVSGNNQSGRTDLLRSQADSEARLKEDSNNSDEYPLTPSVCVDKRPTQATLDEHYGSTGSAGDLFSSGENRHKPSSFPDGKLLRRRARRRKRYKPRQAFLVAKRLKRSRGWWRIIWRSHRYITALLCCRAIARIGTGLSSATDAGAVSFDCSSHGGGLPMPKFEELTTLAPKSLPKSPWDAPTSPTATTLPLSPIPLTKSPSFTTATPTFLSEPINAASLTTQLLTMTTVIILN